LQNGDKSFLGKLLVVLSPVPFPALLRELTRGLCSCSDNNLDTFAGRSIADGLRGCSTLHTLALAYVFVSSTNTHQRYTSPLFAQSNSAATAVILARQEIIGTLLLGTCIYAYSGKEDKECFHENRKLQGSQPEGLNDKIWKRRRASCATMV
jgi:hypothetical protein